MQVLHSQNFKSLLSYFVKVPHKSLTNLEFLLPHLFLFLFFNMLIQRYQAEHVSPFAFCFTVLH